jgi:hypothetical protein
MRELLTPQAERGGGRGWGSGGGDLRGGNSLKEEESQTGGTGHFR